MPVSAETYERLVLEDTEHVWELYGGCLREKPAMTTEHNILGRLLGTRLRTQLPDREWDVIVDQARVRRGDGHYFVPDVFVVPMAMVKELLAAPGTVESYTRPLPLVVEIWSSSTGSYDQNDKLTEYRRRGDAEIWLLHPYNRTLRMYRRQPDGSYTESIVHGGTVQPVALPGVTVDLDELFDALT